jgi:hypothetical protein
VVTDNYVYPFFHLRHGNNLSGWQFWPLAAYEHKDVTLLTNNFGDIETVGGHDKRFLFWPIYYRELTGIGTPNPAEDLGVIPFYARLRSAKRDSTTWLWPLFSRVDDREKQYREWDLPWPLVVFAEGKGKNTTRVFPFYSHAASPTIESGFYLWPVYKYNTIHAAPLERQRHRVLFYLYNHTWERNTETGEKAHRKALWPLFEHKQDLKGNTRLQILAPLEPLIPDNRGIERGWSPLWSIWRSENNAQTGASSQSLLWNLYRRQATPKARTTSCLFGLFQYQSSDEGKRLRLFYVPFGKQPGKGGK